MSASLKLISLNIERSHHLDRVIPFLAEKKADIVCLQELCREDVGRIKSACQAESALYVPMTHESENKYATEVGVGVFSMYPMRREHAVYYRGGPGVLPVSDFVDAKTFVLKNHLLLGCGVETEGTVYTILTTHFTWSPNGEPTDLQRRDMESLLSALENFPDFVLCGDFNMPRGGELFAQLAAKYKDNVPSHYKTSLDASLHRAGKDHPEQLADKMVDGLFSTSHYAVGDVELVSGVSDHCAIVGTISEV